MSLGEYVAGRTAPVSKQLAPYYLPRVHQEPCSHVQLSLPFVECLWDLFAW